MEQPFKDGELMLGTFYPRHYVVAVVPTAADAEQVVQEMQAASCGEAPRHWTAEEVLARHETVHGGRNWLQRAAGLLSVEEGEYIEQYLQHARRGEHFLTVYTPKAEDIE